MNEPTAPPGVPQITPPTQAELNKLSVMERQELLERRREFNAAERERSRQRFHQRLNSWVLLIGVVLTVGGFYGTLVTVRTAQEDLRTSRASQITDQYGKTLEALGSEDASVRMGGLFLLNRLMTDSPRDRDDLDAVLATYLRQHLKRQPIDKTKPLQQMPDLLPDTQAALAVLRKRPGPTPGSPPMDLRDIVAQKCDLSGADLSNAILDGADLAACKLTRANLSGASLDKTWLSYADLSGANLSGCEVRLAKTFDTNFSNTNLSGADLRGADFNNLDFSKANLRKAKLNEAILFATDLRGADLTDADLAGADLKNADLRGVVGVTEEHVRAVAKTNADTLFGD
ncbi:pentapeptide repeat-containing protein [Microtetraspora niveoalba]|uniref:pentapeptide repeat-containing protein n=1 Tax=Microtetraspora niveoalba TaxID=46175 RepID=UPI00082CBCEB|nr:pentapeptide repeat-containing protein [Microtetraspora niveoalba]